MKVKTQITIRNCLNLFSKDFEKIFELVSQVEKGETSRFRLRNLAKTAKKILKSFERFLIIIFSKEI